MQMPGQLIELFLINNCRRCSVSVSDNYFHGLINSIKYQNYTVRVTALHWTHTTHAQTHSPYPYHKTQTISFIYTLRPPLPRLLRWGPCLSKDGCLRPRCWHLSVVTSLLTIIMFKLTKSACLCSLIFSTPSKPWCFVRWPSSISAFIPVIWCRAFKNFDLMDSLQLTSIPEVLPHIL